MATGQSNKKFTTLAALEESDKGRVWALNTSEQVGQRGLVIFTVPKPNGTGGDLVRVLKSFVPMDLTQQVPKNQLMNSAEFRSTIGKGLLRLCTEEYANALLTSEDGREEARRIEHQLRASRMAEETGGVSNTDEDETFDPKNPSGATKEALQEEREARTQRDLSHEVNMRVQTLTADAENENWSAVQIVNALRNHGTFTIVDLRFLKSKFSNKPKVVAFVTDAAEKLRKKMKKT